MNKQWLSRLNQWFRSNVGSQSLAVALYNEMEVETWPYISLKPEYK